MQNKKRMHLFFPFPRASGVPHSFILCCLDRDRCFKANWFLREENQDKFEVHSKIWGVKKIEGKNQVKSTVTKKKGGEQMKPSLTPHHHNQWDLPSYKTMTMWQSCLPSPGSKQNALQIRLSRYITQTNAEITLLKK